MSPHDFVATRSALLSADGLYRYELTRLWAAGPLVCFVMLNPSTADAIDDDATLRRCLGFARAWGFGGLYVVNLFAFRATDPRQLRYAADPVGPHNDKHILDAAARATEVVCAWGPGGTYQQRDAEVRRLLLQDRSRIFSLGRTIGGHPPHPLRLRRDLPRVGYYERMSTPDRSKP